MSPHCEQTYKHEILLLVTSWAKGTVQFPNFEIALETMDCSGWHDPKWSNIIQSVCTFVASKTYDRSFSYKFHHLASSISSRRRMAMLKLALQEKAYFNNFVTLKHVRISTYGCNSQLTPCGCNFSSPKWHREFISSKILDVIYLNRQIRHSKTPTWIKERILGCLIWRLVDADYSWVNRMNKIPGWLTHNHDFVLSEEFKNT